MSSPGFALLAPNPLTLGYVQTNDPQNDNLYPFVFLLPNNQLFIFANRDSILYDWQTNTVAGNLPQIPGESRNYPSGGSAVLLPLSAADGFNYAEVLVCGGAQYGAFLYGQTGTPASKTCGRIAPLQPGADWAMEVCCSAEALCGLHCVNHGGVINF